ncbi:MAG: beta-glucosidase, partial [Muribaculaceae bacterium]|nr:beta-glucosidase [Muribaculaceae bacterium]
MKLRKILGATLALATLMCSAQGNDAKMNAFVDNLMSQMTIEERIGQLNLLPAPTEIVTGTKQTDDFVGKIRKGEVGGVLNCKGVKNVRELQRLNI